jgi:periplasmic divalent cation tolerance protein
METILVMTNLPDQESAQRLARTLIEARLAACVNVLAPCSSIYHWDGKIETAQEVPVWIKTLRSNYDKLEQSILQHHPYELPEIIAVAVTDGLPAYLAWVAAETTTNN